MAVVVIALLRHFFFCQSVAVKPEEEPRWAAGEGDGLVAKV